MSKTVEIRKAVKNVIVTKGGVSGYDVNDIRDALKCNTVEIQNAMNYYRYSPQQKTFRETYNYY